LENGHQERIVHRVIEEQTDEIIGCVMKSRYKWSRNREYVFRQIVCKDVDEDGKEYYIIAAKSVDENVDYGNTYSTVRGSISSYTTFKSINDDQCEMTYYAMVDEKGYIPSSVVNSRLNVTLGEEMVLILNRYQRNAEVDAFQRNEFSDVIKNVPQGYLPEEEGILRRVKEKMCDIPEDYFSVIKSADKHVKMRQHFAEGSTSAVGRATTVVDCNIQDCASWELCKMSREHVVDFYGNGMGIKRELKERNKHFYTFYQVVNIPLPGFLPREFVVNIVWKWCDDEKTKLEVSCESTLKDTDEYKLNSKYIRCISYDHWTYEKLDPLGTSNISQTKITKTALVDILGSMPKWLANANVSKQLSYLSMMRTKFDKSDIIDYTSVNKQIAIIRSHKDNPNSNYTADETGMVDSSLRNFDVFESGTERYSRTLVRPLNTTHNNTTARIAFEQDDPVAWGWSTTIVTASSIEVIALLRDTFSRFSAHSTDLDKCVDEEPSDHNRLVYHRTESTHLGLVSEREHLNRVIWKYLGDGNYIFVSIPEENSEKRPISNGVVRAKNPTALKVSFLTETQSRIEYLIHPDSGGSVPKWLSNKYVSSNLSWIMDIGEFFQGRRELDIWTEEDGRNVGEILVVKHDLEETTMFPGENRFNCRMRIRFSQSKGLQAISKKYPFFEVMMSEVIENKLRPSSDVPARLYNLNIKKGKLIGAGLAVSLISNLTSQAAVEEWIGSYPALQELDKKEVWFRPMLDTVGMRLLHEVAWGLKMRMFSGALLSVLDMASDINVIFLYWGSDDNSEQAVALLGMLIGCIFLQLIVVAVQYKTRPKKMAAGMVLVLTCLKPIVDARKVIAGTEMEVGDSFGANEEFVASKVCELFCESIPGCIIQCYALLKSKEKSYQAIASIAISAATAGFVSASISFDYDVNPVQRKLRPDFYGYIPNSKRRSIVFILMVINSMLLLLVRSVSAAMLMFVDKRYLLWYLFGDSAIFVMQKIARGDFHYWIPVEGVTNIVISLIMRVIIKACADFTGVVQFRHPYELGGLYWTLNIFMALGFSFVAVYVYAQRDLTEALSAANAWNGTIFLTASWLASFVAFLSLCNKGYRRTFFSTYLGKQMTIESFTLGDDDAAKSIIFSCNRNQWRSIEDDVKAWVQEGWWRWDDERPAWFTDAWKSKVNQDWLPREELKAHHHRRKGVRRSSISEQLHMMGLKRGGKIAPVEEDKDVGFIASALNGPAGGKRKLLKSLMMKTMGGAGAKKQEAMDAAAAAIASMDDSSSSGSDSDSDSDSTHDSEKERHREEEEREEEERKKRQKEEKERLEKEAEARRKFREMNGFYWKAVVKENGEKVQTKILDSKASLY
jgi:hypothetical protein